MTNPSEPTQPPAPAQDLSQSYSDLLAQQPWEVDAGDVAPAGPSELASPPPSAPPPVIRVVEALLFVGGPPLTAGRAAGVIRGLTPAHFVQAIDALNLEYRRQGRPYLIRSQEQGYVLTLRPRFRPVLE
jgi:hypothetical protein